MIMNIIFHGGEGPFQLSRNEEAEPPETFVLHVEIPCCAENGNLELEDEPE